MRHHGRGLFRLTKNAAFVEEIERGYKTANLSEGDYAMLAYAEKLTNDPCNMTDSDVAALRKAGFVDGDILDIVQVAAYYNYVNRLACGLNVELEAYWDE